MVTESPAASVSVAVSALAPGASLIGSDQVPSAFGVTAVPLTRTDVTPLTALVEPLTV